MVLDTNVVVGALLASGWNRQILRACLDRRVQPLLGVALYLEYEDLLTRKRVFADSPFSVGERFELLAALASVSEWVEVYFSWRPNLRDESNNHLIELAVAGGAACIVTNNVRDLRSGELRFPSIQVVQPAQFIKEWL